MNNFEPYKFTTKPFACACDGREFKIATPDERRDQHVAVTGLGDICSICRGPVKDAKRKGGK